MKSICLTTFRDFFIFDILTSSWSLSTLKTDVNLLWTYDTFSVLGSDLLSTEQLIHFERTGVMLWNIFLYKIAILIAIIYRKHGKYIINQCYRWNSYFGWYCDERMESIYSDTYLQRNGNCRFFFISGNPTNIFHFRYWKRYFMYILFILQILGLYQFR